MNWKRKYLVGILFLLPFLMSSCAFPTPAENLPTLHPEELTETEPIGPSEIVTPHQAQSTEDTPVLYLGIMVHLEGWTQELNNEEMFNQHVTLIREYASLFETYGAKLTLESKEIPPASQKWGDNVLLEMEQRGHGIGVHADVGGKKEQNCDEMASTLRRMRRDLEDLGVTVRHASGIVSHCDWVNAAVDAGYEFNTGLVAYAVMSLPEEQRPEEYRNCPSPLACHDTFPPALADRLHPWRAESGLNWLTHNPDGGLVILPASHGLACFEESADDTVCHQDFTIGDVNLFFEEFDQALGLVSDDQVNMYYVSWSLGDPISQEIMEIWLQRLTPYIESGRVEWKTLPEIYDIYIEWENSS